MRPARCGPRPWSASRSVIRFRLENDPGNSRFLMEAHVKIPLRMVQTGFMVCLALAASILGAMAQDSKVNTPKKVAHSSVFDTQSAYCTSTGGLVEVRHAVFGTNGPENTWLKLAGQQGFCQYTASDGSRIHLNLSTQQPTLAALAYYAEVPPNGGGEGNPASFYCTQLGGAEIGATDPVAAGSATTAALMRSLKPASSQTIRRLTRGDCSTTPTPSFAGLIYRRCCGMRTRTRWRRRSNQSFGGSRRTL
jgi:putative hemolysin